MKVKKAEEIRSYQELNLTEDLIPHLEAEKISSFILDARSFIGRLSDPADKIFFWDVFLSCRMHKVKPETLKAVVNRILSLGLIRDDLRCLDQILFVLTGGSCTLYWAFCCREKTDEAKKLNKAYEKQKKFSPKNVRKILQILSENLPYEQYEVLQNLIESGSYNLPDKEDYNLAVKNIYRNASISKRLNKELGGLFSPILISAA